ncbi:MAG: hypothetical protein RLW42_08640 [Gammaproteobacteria bacterium]
MFNVADYLRLVAPALPNALVDASSRTTIEALAERLPGALTSFCGFECPLDTAAARADFLLCSTREEGHVAVLAGRHGEARLEPALLATPSWQRVGAFCSAWLDDRDVLAEHLMNTWLEFDVASRADALAHPSLFYGTHAPPAHVSAADQLAVHRAALALLAPEAVAGARGHALDAFFDALPAGSHVFQDGVMWARETGALRLCLRHLSPADLLSLLARCDWPGRLDDAAALLDELAPTAARIDADVDLGTTLGPKLGLECYTGTDAAAGARLDALAALLVDHGACTPAKAAALHAYQGLRLADADPCDWPRELSEFAAARGRGMTSALLRWVHHVKVVLEPGQAVTAKAYLAIEHHVLARAALRATIDAMREQH